MALARQSAVYAGMQQYRPEVNEVLSKSLPPSMNPAPKRLLGVGTSGEILATRSNGRNGISIVGESNDFFFYVDCSLVMCFSNIWHNAHRPLTVKAKKP